MNTFSVFATFCFLRQKISRGAEHFIDLSQVVCNGKAADRIYQVGVWSPVVFSYWNCQRKDESYEKARIDTTLDVNGKPLRRPDTFAHLDAIDQGVGHLKMTCAYFRRTAFTSW